MKQGSGRGFVVKTWCFCEGTMRNGPAGVRFINYNTDAREVYVIKIYIFIKSNKKYLVYSFS